jgi:hypothetical protein
LGTQDIAWKLSERTVSLNHAQTLNLQPAGEVQYEVSPPVPLPSFVNLQGFLTNQMSGKVGIENLIGCHNGGKVTKEQGGVL